MHSKNRLSSLDYLRGLSAFGIMIYHYTSWLLAKSGGSTSFFAGLGIYGVSVFYVLSGLTLYHVYINSLSRWEEVKGFYVKRLFRIFPLLWLAILGTLAVSWEPVSPFKLFLNLTGLFGLVDWAGYIATGSWSIGNELVFYLFLPVMVLLARKSKWLFGAFTFLFLLVYMWFAYIKIDPALSFEAQWVVYTNPLNQVFLFIGGFGIGCFLERVRPGAKTSLFLLLVSVACFFGIPETDKVHLISGNTRMLFTLVSLLLCFSFYRLPVQFPSLVHRPLAVLGEISFSLYLVHPLVYKVGSRTFAFIGRNFSFWVPKSLQFPFYIIVTLVLSYLLFQYFEKRFIRMGKSVLKGQPQPAVSQPQPLHLENAVQQ